MTEPLPLAPGRWSGIDVRGPGDPWFEVWQLRLRVHAWRWPQLADSLASAVVFAVEPTVAYAAGGMGDYVIALRRADARWVKLPLDRSAAGVTDPVPLADVIAAVGAVSEDELDTLVRRHLRSERKELAYPALALAVLSDDAIPADVRTSLAGEWLRTLRRIAPSALTPAQVRDIQAGDLSALRALVPAPDGVFWPPPAAGEVALLEAVLAAQPDAARVLADQLEERGDPVGAAHFRPAAQGASTRAPKRRIPPAELLATALDDTCSRPERLAAAERFGKKAAPGPEQLAEIVAWLDRPGTVRGRPGLRTELALRLLQRCGDDERVLAGYVRWYVEGQPFTGRVVEPRARTSALVIPGLHAVLDAELAASGVATLQTPRYTPGYRAVAELLAQLDDPRGVQALATYRQFAARWQQAIRYKNPKGEF